MNLKIVRDTFNDTETLGMLYLNGVKVCETLELPWKDNTQKVSCIPTGQYDVVHRTSERFKEHLHILNVPGRKYILIHAGNTHNDILGCVLPGLTRGKLGSEVAVLSSRKALAEILRLTKSSHTIKLEIE